MASVDEVLDAIESLDLDRPWAEVADDLLPVLPRRRPFPGGMDDPLHRPWPPGLDVTFGLDIGPAFLYVGSWALERWGVTEDELVDRALANVRRHSGARQMFGLIQELVGGEPLSAFQSREGWASTLLLVPDELARVFGDEPSLVMAPSRDVLLRFPIHVDPELARWLLDDFASLDPNALDVPLLALVDGSLSFVSGSPARWRRDSARRH
jgi:hypothetical protein